MTTRRPLVVANWKMNGLKGSIAELKKIIAGARTLAAVEIVVCPPSTLVAEFALAARRAGLGAIICIGETRAERDAGQTRDVVRAQLDGSLPDEGEGVVIAYEPIWAIGTGLTPTRDDVSEIHAFIRARLSSRFGEIGRDMRVLYGGSVKPNNASELLRLENVDGALVGGASLYADEFLAIAATYR